MQWSIAFTKVTAYHNSQVDKNLVLSTKIHLQISIQGAVKNILVYWIGFSGSLDDWKTLSQNLIYLFPQNFQGNRLLFRWWMDHDLGENQSAFSISLFCLDDWTRSNLTLVKNLESISFVSPRWKPMRRMKTPWKRNRKMYKKFVGFTNWHESRVSGLGWNLTRDWGNQNASFFCNTCHSIDNAESVGFQDIAERTRDKSNLHPK